MASEEDKTTVEKPDESQAEAPKKGSKKILLFAGIGIVCIGLGVGAALMMTSGSAGPAADGEAAASHETAKATQEKPKRKKKIRKEGEANAAIVYAIKDIVVNPAGTGGSRFLSASFGFELDSPELEAEFEEREPLVRDALITILSSKTVAQLTDVKQKEIMRYQIKKRLSKLMDTEGLEAVYYTDFVLQ